MEDLQVASSVKNESTAVSRATTESITSTYYVQERTVTVVVMVVGVFFSFILDIKFVGRTSRGHTGGRSHRIYHLPSFCSACLNFSREKDSAIIPLLRRP